MAKEKLKVAIYTRVSSEEQAREGYSLAAQERTLKEFCEIKGYKIYNMYTDEGISAKDIKNRPSMLKLLTDAKEKKFNIILVWKLTRFTRRLSDLTTTCEELDKLGICLVSYSESFDSVTPAGRMVCSMLGTVAQFEREVISENVKLGLDERAKQGKRTCHEILGYDLYGKDSFTINEDEAKYVKFIFVSYLKYKNLLQVADLCRQNNYRGKRGRLPTAQSILIVLTQPTYCGYNRYCGKIYEGKHESIIDRDTYNKVQQLLRKQGKFTGRTRKKELRLLPA